MSVCSLLGGGVPHPYPSPSLSIPVWGGTQSSLGWRGGTPIQPWMKGGVPQSSLGQGGTPIQPWMGGYPNLGWGGYPNLGWGGYPNLGWGVPHLWGGTPSHVWGVPHPRIASTCYGYAAGGVPLAFTQEDFLVDFVFTLLQYKCTPRARLH